MLFIVPHALASLPVQIDVLADPAAGETIESVSDPRRAVDFVPAPMGLAAGYTRTVHWLRIRLDAPFDDDRLLLEILPTYLDDLQLYLPDGKGGFRLRQTGDIHPFASREIRTRGFVFNIMFADKVPQTLFLRIQTTSTSLVIPRIWQPADYDEAQNTEYLLLGLYYGVLIAMLAFNLWHGHWRHDLEHRAFLIYLLSVLLFMLAFNGLVAQYFSPSHPRVGHHLLSAMVMLITGAAAHFHRRILAIDRSTPFLNAYFLGMIGLSAICLVAQLAGHFTEAARVLTLAALLFPILGIIRTFVLWRQGRLGSHFLPLAYGISLAAYLLTTLSLQGLLQGSHWQLYSFQGGTLLALLAFNFGLFERLRHIQRQRDAALEDMEHARLARDAEALARQRQGALLAMLTHELKTPLAVIRLALDRLNGGTDVRRHAATAIADISSVIDRCRFADRLDQSEIRIERQTCRMEEVLAECRATAGQPERTQLAIPAPLPDLTSDANLLHTLCTNLLDNALKYGSPAVPVNIVAITLEHESDGHPGIAVTFANHPGPVGLPDPARLFERYYRAPAAHALSGSGLGLYLVRQLTQLLGGEIRYHPPGDDGALRFVLWLPLEPLP